NAPIKQEINQEKRQVDINSPGGKQEIINTVKNSKDLSQSQKEDFFKLQKETNSKITQINKQIAKLKIVLTKSMFQEKTNEKKNKQIISQLKSLNREKMDIKLDSYYKSRKIMG